MVHSSRPEPEVGAIRPPSEAGSLLVRLVRNCPWNRCAFCPVYKGARFSVRAAAEVIGDIDGYAEAHERIRAYSWGIGSGGEATREVLGAFFTGPDTPPWMHSLLMFMAHGSHTVFLQDGDPLIVKPAEAEAVLLRLRERFPDVTRITTYGRSHTLARRSEPELGKLRAAGLTRVHIGLESGSDRVLELMRKGVTVEQHVAAGRQVKAAGLELSEYVMPGLGGRRYLHEHAVETARAVVLIQPDFVRLRTLVLPPEAAPEVTAEFEDLTETEIVQEIRLFVENLAEYRGELVSDHQLNLLPEIAGKFPEAQPEVLRVIDEFLSLPPEERLIYQTGRRLGIFAAVRDLAEPRRRDRALEVLEQIRARFGEEAESMLRKVMSGRL